MLDARGPIGRKRAGLATEGSGFWTSAPCQAVAGPDSGALPFPRHRALLVQTKADRHANGSPFGGAGERSETERASRLSQSRCTAISRLFVRAILSQCKSCLSASLPSPSLLRNATSPKGRGFGRPGNFLLDAESPTGRKRAGLATEGRPVFVQPLSLLRRQLPL